MRRDHVRHARGELLGVRHVEEFVGTVGVRVRPQDPVPAPDISESEPNPPFRVLSLDALVRMKLTAFRLKDRVHLTEAVATAEVELLGDDVGEKLTRLDRDAEVDRLLADLKARRGLRA